MDDTVSELSAFRKAPHPARGSVSGGWLAWLLTALLDVAPPAAMSGEPPPVFARGNLVAWCVVPFDAKKRGPDERAAMLRRLGFSKFAYDWRAEHLPTFEAEIAALKKQQIRLQAVWFPAELNADARLLLAALQRHQLRTQLWVMIPQPSDSAKTQEPRLAEAAGRLAPVAAAAEAIGCRVSLYNHGGWSGEPENQLAIIQRLARSNVGMVYNLHHGHDHIDRFAKVLGEIKPHLDCLNLNGMLPRGDRVGQKILPLGAGTLDVALLRTIVASGYTGPIGIIGHTDHDAEERLRDNLDGLDWCLRVLSDGSLRDRPAYRTHPNPFPLNRKSAAGEKEAIAFLLNEARTAGDVQRGADVFRSAKYACMTCHRVGGSGGTVGPDLSLISRCGPPETLVESVLWPAKQVRDGYAAIQVTTSAGQSVQGYKHSENERELVLKDPANGAHTRLAKSEIEARRDVGTLMPAGLAEAMTDTERRDLIRFLLELGRGDVPNAEAIMAHKPAPFTFSRAPLHPERWPNWQAHVNRDRVYDYYTKQADYFRRQATLPHLLPAFPDLDGGKLGHWGNQKESTWADNRWNSTDVGTLMAGVFRAPGVTVPRGICVRLGERGEMSVCFNPDTLTYDALWSGGFVKFSSVRHGFMDGITPAGTILPRPDTGKPNGPFEYLGLYRDGPRVVFAYRVAGVEMLDAPWVEDGKFVRTVAPLRDHPLAKCVQGGRVQWPQVIAVRGQLGQGAPYAVDTLPPPFDNPWKALCFFGDHDFLDDGSALVSSMTGDVWHVTFDDALNDVRWRRFASGLHQPLGLKVVAGVPYVLGRDQITKLHDRNGDGEADFYERFSAAYITSPGGHDYVCGLHRDGAGRFYTASSNQGLLRISADGQRCEVLATGFRNPDGVGLHPDGAVTVPASEGDWTPASMICEVHPDRDVRKAIGNHRPPFFGWGGPRHGQPPDLPLVYLPRGLDNSSGGQVHIDSKRWGPLDGQMVHFSYGAGTHFLLLRDQVNGQPQGAVVALPGDFNSGVHRGRFSPRDGQLYVSGMGGWGTYTALDGCFQRVRYTGGRVQLPVGWRAHENGIAIRFSAPVDPVVAATKENYLAQAWNYRYRAQYGSPEFSARHPNTIGHDPLAITAVHLLPDGRSVFLTMPDLQPVNQLHVHMKVDGGEPLDLFATVHELAPAFGQPPEFPRVRKTIAAHPIRADLASTAKPLPNPHRKPLANAREIAIAAGPNLTYSTRSFTVRRSEAIKLTFSNPDTVPHNWALLQPGTLETVGSLANKLVADPEAVLRHYVPASNDVLAYTDVVEPSKRVSIYFTAPAKPGRYPYLCTFPGHWMVMNGEMVVQ